VPPKIYPGSPLASSSGASAALTIIIILILLTLISHTEPCKTVLTLTDKVGLQCAPSDRHTLAFHPYQTIDTFYSGIFEVNRSILKVNVNAS